MCPDPPLPLTLDQTSSHTGVEGLLTLGLRSRTVKKHLRYPGCGRPLEWLRLHRGRSTKRVAGPDGGLVRDAHVDDVPAGKRCPGKDARERLVLGAQVLRSSDYRGQTA